MGAAAQVDFYSAGDPLALRVLLWNPLLSNYGERAWMNWIRCMRHTHTHAS